MEVSRLAKIVGGVALLWYGVLRGARGLITRVESYGFRSIDVNTGTVSLNLNILIKNPLFVGIKLQAITGTIYAQGQAVGTVNTTLNYYLSGGHTHIIPVTANLAMGNVLQSALLNIQSGDVRTLTVSFDGKLLVGQYGVGIPVQIDLDYNDLTA